MCKPQKPFLFLFKNRILQGSYGIPATYKRLSRKTDRKMWFCGIKELVVGIIKVI